jgi:hypothetical protein
VLRRIFGPKREEVTGGRRELRNEELHNLSSQQYNHDNQIIENEMDGIRSMHERCLQNFGRKS